MCFVSVTLWFFLLFNESFLIYIDNFSEELLYHHDEELIKIKEIYEEAKCLYDSVHKWEATLDRFIELEVDALSMLTLFLVARDNFLFF